MRKCKNKKGFTLAELLIVVAIIAVLVAIAIAVFSGQMEKARRAVDMQNARAIQSALTNAYSTGEISIKGRSDAGVGVWVLLCRDNNSKPGGYGSYILRNGTVFCGADNGVSIKGETGTTESSYKQNVEKILEESGINVDSLKIRSNTDPEKNTGWDWIVVQLVMYGNGEVKSYMYSGFAGESSSVNWYNRNHDNLGKQIY